MFSCYALVFLFQAMFDWLDNTVIRLCTMPPVGTDLNTVKDQLNEMKVCTQEWLGKDSCFFLIMKTS